MLVVSDLKPCIEAHADAVLAREAENCAITQAILAAISVPDDASCQVAKHIAEERPEVRSLVEQLFGEEAHLRWRQYDDQRRQRDDEEAARRAAERFSSTRLEEELHNGDWIAAVGELRLPVEGDDSSHQIVEGTALSERPTWGLVGDSERARCLELAESCLCSAPERGVVLHPRVAFVAAEAYALLDAVHPDRLDRLPQIVWLAWLPNLVDLPGHHEVTAGVLNRAADEAHSAAVEIILEVAHRDATSGYISVLHSLGEFWPPELGRPLLELARDNSTSSTVIADILDHALDHDFDAGLDVAFEIMRRRPATKPIRGEGGQPTSSETSWDQAVDAAAAIGRAARAQDAWPRLFAEFKRSPAFAHDVFGRAGRYGADALIRNLGINENADFYLWIRETFEVPRRPSRGAYRPDPAEDIQDRVLARLRDAGTTPAAEACERIANATGSEWHRTLAAEAWRQVRATTWTPLLPADLAQILDDPRRRPVRTEPELVQAVLEAVDEFQSEVQADAALRTLFWHRQRVDGEWRGWVPRTETEVSDLLANELRRRLGTRMFIGREVEIQPPIGEQRGEHTDLLITVPHADGETVGCIVEVKCNWNRNLASDIREQLADRYLRGAVTRTGIYLVAWFSGRDWDDSDSGRRGRAARNNRHELGALLEDEARVLSGADRMIHSRVIDLSLESQ